MSSSLVVSDRIRTYMNVMTCDPKYSGFDTQLLRRAQYIGCDLEQRMTYFKFTVEEFMSNIDGNLHGGAATTIFDNLSSTSLFTLPDLGSWDNLGVSRSLHVTFHKPLGRGAVVDLKCRVVTVGRRLAHMEATMTASNGQLCASCIHEKVSVPPLKL